MDKILALYDSDSVYATRFMEYFSREEMEDFEIVTFTCTDHIVRYMLTHCIYVLLFGDKVEIDAIPINKINHVYHLIENQAKDKESQFPTIIKYQSVKQIMKRVLSDLSERGENVYNQDPNHITVQTLFAPHPQLETISYAWSLSAMNSEQKNTLFVLFDLFPIPLLSPISNMPCLSDLIYYLKEKNNVPAKLQSLVKEFSSTGMNNSINYLSGIYHCSDLLSLTKEDVRNLVELLKTKTGYHSIIFYLGFASEAMMELMNLSDFVSVLTVDSVYESELIREWKEQMNRIEIPYHPDQYEVIVLQEDDFPKLPVSFFELSQSLAWESALHSLNSHEARR